MQQFRVPGLGYRLVLALAGAAVALTAGFAGVTFVRLVGLVVLGRGHRSPDAGPARWRTGLGPGRAAVAGRWRGGCLAIAARDSAGDPGDRGRAVARSVPASP